METTSRMLNAFSPKPKDGGLRAKHCPIAKRYLEIQAQEQERARLAESGWDWDLTDMRPSKGSPAIDAKDFAPSNAHHQTTVSRLMTVGDEASAAKQRKGKNVAKSRLRISEPRFPDLADAKAESHSHGGMGVGARHREASHHRRSSASRSNDISKRNGYHQHQKSSSSTSSAQTFVAQPSQSRFSESSSGSPGPPPRRPSRTGIDNLLTYEGLGKAMTRPKNQGSAPTTSTAPNKGPQGRPSAHRPLKPTPPPIRGFGDTSPQRAHKPASHSGSHAHSRSLSSSKPSASVGQQAHSSSSPAFTLSPATASQLDFNPSFIISPLSPSNNNLVDGGFAALRDNASVSTKDPLAQRTDSGTLDTKIGCTSDTTSDAINRQRKAVRDLHQHLNALNLPTVAGSRDSALTFQSSAATIVADEENTLTTTHDKESSQPASPTFPSQPSSSHQQQHRRKRSSVVKPIFASRSAARPLSGGRRSTNTKRHSRGASSLSKQGKPTAWLETEEEEMLPVSQDQSAQHIARKAISNNSTLHPGHKGKSMRSPGLQSQKNLKSAWSTRGERTATKWSVPDSVHDIFTGQRFNRPTEVNEIISSDRLDQLRQAKMAQAAAAKQAAAEEEARHSSGSEGSTPSLGTGSDTSDSSLWSVLSHHPDYQRRGSPATPPLGASPTAIVKKQVIKRKALPPLPTTRDSRRNTTHTEKSSANGDIPIMFEGSFLDDNVSPLRIIKRNAASPPLPAAPIPPFALDPTTLPNTPPLPPKSGLRGGKLTAVSPSGSHSRNASDGTASTSMSAEQAEHVVEGSSADTSPDLAPLSDTASLTSSSSSIYSAAPFSPGPATPVSPSKAQEIKDMFLDGEDEDNFYLRSTPYTLMHPGFAHGPIRLHKRSLSSTAAAARMALPASRNSSPATTKSRSGRNKGPSPNAMGSSMDWTAFQMAILGGAPEMGEITGEIEDSKTADELSGWYSDLGFSNEGRLVEESEGKSAKISGKVEPVERAPPATDRQSETGAGDVAISPTTKSSSPQPPRLSINIESFNLTDPTASAGSVDSNLPYRISPDESLPALTPAPLSVRRQRPVLPKLQTTCLRQRDGTLRKGSFEALQANGGPEPFRVASAPTTTKPGQPPLHPPRILAAASKSEPIVPTLNSQQQQPKGLLSRVKGLQQPRPVLKQATSPQPNQIHVPAPHSIRDTDTFDAPRAAFAIPARSATPEPLRTKKMQDPVSNRSSSAMGRQQAPENLNFSQEIAARQQAMTSRSQSARVEQEPFKAPSPVKGFQLQTSQLQLPPPRKPKEKKSEEGMNMGVTTTISSGNGSRGGRAKNYTLAPSDYSLTNINRGLSAKRSQNFQIGGSSETNPAAIDEGITFSKPIPDRTLAHLPSDDNITFKTPAKTAPRKGSSPKVAAPQSSIPFKNTPPSVTGGATQQPLIVGQDTDKFVVESDDLSSGKAELDLDQPMGFNLSSDLGDFLRYEAEYAYATDL